MVGSLFVSLINVICVMPFDAMKTMMQKADPTATLFDTVSSVFK